MNRAFTCLIEHQKKKQKIENFPVSHEQMERSAELIIKTEEEEFLHKITQTNWFTHHQKLVIGKKKKHIEGTAQENRKPGRGGVGEIQNLTSELMPRLSRPQTHEHRGKGEEGCKVQWPEGHRMEWNNNLGEGSGLLPFLSGFLGLIFAVNRKHYSIIFIFLKKIVADWLLW